MAGNYHVSLGNVLPNSHIVVVGCGGTGSFVAEGLCRLLIGVDASILLVDPDRIEKHNLLRQSFYPGEVGMFKSEALAQRLSRQYGRRIGYSVLPYDPELAAVPMGGGYSALMNIGLLIGCVDNAEARRDIARSLRGTTWWLDTGNGESSGQVLLGNMVRPADLQEGFDEPTAIVTSLPAPSLQQPSLLVPRPRAAAPRPDCAEEVADNRQGPLINQAMAVLVLDFINRLLRGTLSWMGVYLDMDAGTLQTVPADPQTVARICSVKTEYLFTNRCALGARYQLGKREEIDDTTA